MYINGLRYISENAVHRSVSVSILTNIFVLGIGVHIGTPLDSVQLYRYPHFKYPH